ncbi:MAG: carboxymuconolactone decarboxylase family protein [Herbaspirillum sp.]
MARIPYFNLAQAPASYLELLQSRKPLNLYRMLPYAGKGAEGFLALGGALLRENTLDAKLREIAILRVGILSNASYEVYQHKHVAQKVGLHRDKVAALEIDADTSALDKRDLMILKFTDQLVHHVKASDEMFSEMVKEFSENCVAELVMTIGFYMMVSRFLENFEVDIEPSGTINYE